MTRTDRTALCDHCELARDYDEYGECVICGLFIAPDENPREKYDDDGREYADPRDFRDGVG